MFHQNSLGAATRSCPFGPHSLPAGPLVSYNSFMNTVFKSFEEPDEKPNIEIRRVLPPAAAHLALTAHLPDRP